MRKAKKVGMFKEREILMASSYYNDHVYMGKETRRH